MIECSSKSKKHPLLVLRGNDGLSIWAIQDHNHHPPVIIWAIQDNDHHPPVIIWAGQDNNVIQKIPVRKRPLVWKLRRRPNVKYVLFETRFRRRWSVSNGKFRRRTKPPSS